MKTNTSLSIKIILIVFFLFTLGITYGQSNKTPNKTTSRKEITTENPNPNTRINRCSTVEYEKYLQEKNPKRISEAQFESWLAPLVKLKNSWYNNNNSSCGSRDTQWSTHRNSTKYYRCSSTIADNGTQ